MTATAARARGLVARADDAALHAGTEVALLLVTLAAIAGTGRLFDSGEYLPPLALHAVTAHAVVALLRRRGLALVPAAIVTAGVMAIAVGVIHYPSTTFALLPTGETWRSASTDLSGSWNLFQEVSAPAPVEVGFLVATAITVWFVAFVADWAAMRLWVPFEATLPAATLFVFASILGADEKRVSSAAAFAAAVIVFLLVHRVARQARSSHWVGDPDGRGRRSMLVTGGALAGVAVILASAGGPLLPGARSGAVIDLNEISSGPEGRVTVSPLVDIRARLVEQAPVEVFRVRSEERAYWRLTSLDEFNGEIWSSSGSYGRAGGDLDPQVVTAGPTASIVQDFEVLALAAIWLPAAYEPREVEVDDIDVRFDEVSETLIVDQDVASSDGLVYRVRSEAPRLDAELLTRGSSDIPGAIADRYLQLPGGFPDRVRDLAAEVTGGRGAATPYARARALQDFFRADFEYDLDVGPGHSSDALERFLFEARRGYCEQFAGAYAAMARALGIPARVAVGFTPGQVVAGGVESTTYSVRGENAHAWPEVFIGGIGWVAFEPTPNRGAPFAEAYTGVPEQQAAPGDSAGVVTGPGDVTPTSAPPGDVPTIPTAPPTDQSTPFPEEFSTGGGGATADGTSFWERAALVLVGAVGAAATLAALYVVVVVVTRDVRRRARRRAASSAANRARLAGVEVAETAQLVGAGRRAHETHAEYGGRLAGVLPELSDDVRSLFGTLEIADYAPDPIGDGDADVAAAAGRHVCDTVRGYVGWRRLLVDELHWRHVTSAQQSRRHAAAAPRGSSGLVATEPVAHAAAGIAE